MRTHRAVIFLFAGALACAACATQGKLAPTFLPASCDDPNAGPSTPLVYLDVAAKERGVVQRQANGEWCTLCEAPCKGYVPASGVYRISLGGGGGRPTTEFSMPNSARVLLRVDDEGNVRVRTGYAFGRPFR